MKHRSETLACFQPYKMEAILKFFRIFLFHISTSLVIFQAKSPQTAQKVKKKVS